MLVARLARSLAFSPVLLAAPLSAQCGDWSPEFRELGFDDRVRALAEYDPPGSAPLAVYAGGDFTLTQFGPASHVASWDGSTWSPLGAGIDGLVACLLAFDDGSGSKLYAGGSFQSAGGHQAFFVAAWNGSDWSPVGGGLSGLVLDLCAYDDGSGTKLYAAGQFTVPGDPIGANVAVWNGSQWSVVAGGTNAIVWSLCAHDDGTGAKLYAAGSFTQAGATNAQRIASFDGTAWSALGSGLNASAYGIASYAGALYVGGDFGIAGGTAVSFAARWSSGAFTAAGAFELPVRRLETIDLGAGPLLYALGDRDFVQTTFVTQLASYDGSAWTAIPSSLGDALIAHDSGQGRELWLAGGSPSSGQLRANVQRREGTTWKPIGVDRTFSRPVLALATWQAPAAATPSLFVMGQYQSGLGDIETFASWDGYQFTRLTDPIQLGGQVSVMKVANDGSGEGFYVAGDFLTVGGVWAARIARWDGAQFLPLGPGLNGSVEAIATWDDGNGPALYAGGQFTATNDGVVSTSRVARWDGSTWSALPGGPNGIVEALCVFDDGTGSKLYAGGGFTAIGGGPARFFARWNGASWESFGDPAFFAATSSQGVTCMLVHDDGSGRALYAAGYLPRVGSASTNRVIRWDGAAWSEVALVGNNSTFAQCMTEWDDGTGGGSDLYLAGNFTSPTQRLARWDGVQMRPVAGGAGGTSFSSVNAMAVVPNANGTSDLFAGGSFLRVRNDTISSPRVARLVGCGPITSFCAGDGLDAHVTTHCPCDNFGIAGHGCAWSGGQSGARLETSGTIAPDTLVLTARFMPAAGTATVFWKGDAVTPFATPWGDGLRCIDGALIRLGTKNNAGGIAQYPETGNALVSVRGQTPVGSGAVAYYQTSYRNAASFCTPFTYNATNGVRIVW